MLRRGKYQNVIPYIAKPQKARKRARLSRNLGEKYVNVRNPTTISPLSLMAKKWYSLKNYYGRVGILLHIPIGEHLIHRYAQKSVVLFTTP